MQLAVDIGNTNIVLATFQDDIWTNQVRIKTNDPSVTAKVEEYCYSLDFDDAVLSSVVPSLTTNVKNAIDKVAGIDTLVISNKIRTGLDNSTIPDELGSDILCNLIKAHNLFPNDYVTVADFGTAFTTSTVSPEGKVLGVTIGPGMMTSVKALFSNTAQLPEIRLDIPKTVLGRDTVGSIRAGVVFGFTGQLTAIVNQIEKEIGQPVKVLATGGFSKYITGLVEKLDYSDINLTLDGARIALSLNRNLR